ncbi:MAG: hypothetical protein U5L45_09230 [Saprospiraceae bacterium]|nr:hypothetical protein [Saprospiraceae bacterium]
MIKNRCFALASLAQKGRDVVRFSAKPKNEPLFPFLRAKRARD